MEELHSIIDKLSEYALDISQSKVYTTSLCEFILSIYQQVQLYKQIPSSNSFVSSISSSSLDNVIKALVDAANFLISNLQNDPQFQRKEDAQNDYLFEREEKELIQKIIAKINAIQVSTERANEEAAQGSNGKATFQFDAHAKYYPKSAVSGVMLPEELTNDPRTFHLVGHESFGGRSSMLKKVLLAMENQKEQAALSTSTNAFDSLAKAAQQRLKVILVNGVTGVGKSNFALHLCREICKENQIQRKYHLRLRANTKQSLTTTEAMQYVIQTWRGQPLPIHEKQLRDVYHQSFIGVSSLLYLEDPANIHQVLALLPYIKYSPSSKAIVVISSRSSLKLDFDRFSKGYIDLVNEDEIKQVRDRIPEEDKTSIEGGSIAIDQIDLENFSDHESDFGSSDDDSDNESDKEEDVPTSPVNAVGKFHIKKTPHQKKMEKELKAIFGSTQKKTVSIHIGTKDDDEKLPIFQRQFDVIYCQLETLTLDQGSEMILSLNPSVTMEEGRSLAALADNIPIFMKIATRCHMLYVSDHTLSDYSIHVSSYIDEHTKPNFPQLRKLCEGFIIGAFQKWPKELQSFALKLSIFPFSFDVVSASLITETPLHETLQHIQLLVFMGLLIGCEPNRFCYHDLVRDTLVYHCEEMPDDDPVKVAVQECDERYTQHYYNLLGLYNLQHEYSGIMFMPGVERYDMDIENMKQVIHFLRDLSDEDYIDGLNNGRYIFRNVIYAIDRGRMYTYFENNAAIDKVKSEFGKAQFYEGFALVYFDLMDHKNAFIKAKKALELLENACILSEEPSDELKKLPVLHITGDIALRQNQHDIAMKYFEKMVDIATKNAHEWQKLKIESNEEVLEGFEKDEYIIKDIFIGKAMINQARIYMHRGETKLGKQYFERGLMILQRIYHRYHPLISDALASYASLLRDLKNSKYYDDVIKYYKEAVEINAKIFGETSFQMGEIYDGYAIALLLQQKFKEAEVNFKKSLEIRKKYFGESDLTVSSTHNNLAICLKHLKKYEEASEHYTSSMTILTNLYGPNDSRVATLKTNVAKLKLETNSDIDEIQKSFEEALESLQDEEIKGEKGRQMASTLASMADTQRQKQNYDKAIELYEQSMAVLEEVKKTTNPESTDYLDILGETARILYGMATLHYDKQQYKEASELLDRGMEIIDTKLGGAAYPLYSNFLSLSANAKLNKKDLSGAEAIYLKVIEMKTKQQQPKENFIATFQALAVCLDRQAKYEPAIEYYNKVLDLLKEVSPNELDKIITVKKAIASCHTKRDPKDFESAEKVFEEVEQLVLKKTGNDNNLEYGELINDLGACRVQLQKIEDAILNFATCERIFAEFYGDNHDKTITARENVANLRMMLQQRQVEQGCCCCIVM
ncbi:hypothetical protein ABK040_006712 [Willaertia magna]